MIPLILRLKKSSHREIAKSQDIIVETLYEVFRDAVIHGGTAIWRCYGGKRFSEDIDVYIKKDVRKIDLFFKALERKGFRIKKKKVSEKSIYSDLEIGRTHVRFEASFRKVKGSLHEYETVEGNFISVYTLTEDEFVREKILAYLGRLKVRDLYDIFFLLHSIKHIFSVEKDLSLLVKNFRAPEDEKNLRVLVYEGLVPSSEGMIDYVKRRIRNG